MRKATQGRDDQQGKEAQEGSDNGEEAQDDVLDNIMQVYDLFWLQFHLE